MKRIEEGTKKEKEIITLEKEVDNMFSIKRKSNKLFAIQFILVVLLAISMIEVVIVRSATAAYRPVVMGRYGMVTSTHPLASQAGMRILNQGGNAFDATVAVVNPKHGRADVFWNRGGRVCSSVSR
jgi:hypothetical protein